MKKLILTFMLLSIFTLASCSEKDSVNETEASDVESSDAAKIKEIETKLEEHLYEGALFKILYSKISNSEDLKVISTKFINKLIKEENTKFLYDNYEDTFKESTLFDDDSKNKIVKYLDEAKEKLLDKMEKLIINNDARKASKLYLQSAILNEDDENEQGSALYHYAMYIQDDENPRASSELAIAVKPSYEGRLENEISEAVSKGSIDRFYWGVLYYDNQRDSKRIEPFVGMTDKEALKSTWRKPTKINTTKNINGTSEQWVYDNYKYLYFENGILTSIQY